MIIRPFTKNDINQCVKIFIDAYNRLPWNYNWNKIDAAKYLEEYTDVKNFVGFVIIDNDELVGAMFAHSKTWWTNNQLYIDELFVTAQKQGKGYGKQLINHTQQYCKENKIEMITLMTNKFMPALKFYNSLDFVKVDQYVFMFKQVE